MAVAPIATATALIGCTAQSPEGRKQQLTISAAASLQNALTEITPLFEKAHPDTEIFYNWGGSGTLQRQIEQGAPADIFFPASRQQMKRLTQQNLVRTEPTANQKQLLGNELVLIAPLDSPLTGFEDLTDSPATLTEQSRPATKPAPQSITQLAVGEFQSVPAGQYAQATLTKLNLLTQLTPNLVFFSNVRGVLAAVENGHAEAGLVYRTDAELSDRVKIIAIAPPTTHPPIHYPVAILQRAEDLESAQAYIDFLKTPAAQQVFEQFGFTTLGSVGGGSRE
ncbi:MAG: molybdate ABC transporter substrate-binding protein [Cyanobacteria bacterium J06598_3]